jgi:hypothetical protein
MKTKHFEMASSDDPRGMIMATQRSVIMMLKGILRNVRANTPQKIPGLTWEQLDYLLDEAAKKEPEIIFQEHDQ